MALSVHRGDAGVMTAEGVAAHASHLARAVGPFAAAVYGLEDVAGLAVHVRSRAPLPRCMGPIGLAMRVVLAGSSVS